MLELLSGLPLPEWLFQSLTGSIEGLQKALISPVFSTSRIFIGFLFTSSLFAVFSYIYYSRKDNKTTSIKGFFRFLVPKNIYLSNSTLVDLKLFLAYRVTSGLLTPILGLMSITAFSLMFSSFLAKHWVSPGWASGSYGPYIFAFLYLLIADFAYYVAHALSHKNHFLWQFHAVHHSPKVMTPLTLYRLHPLDAITFKSVKNVIEGMLLGGLIFLFMGKVDIYRIFGMNFIYFVFTVAASNLRHSHIWISWGRVLNHIFISPAHHQIHHSARMKHWGKNHGQVFAIWDWMFGTLMLPSEEIRKNLVMGLFVNKPDPHTGFRTATAYPFQMIGKMLRQRFKTFKSGSTAS